MSSNVEQIKSRLGVVDVVQSYLKLINAGSNLKAACPFHKEKTPSFFVSPSRESWHCFGCNRGGDIFSFVMEIEGVEFPEALKILAARAGVELEQVDMKQVSERSRLVELLETAKRFYENELKKNSDVIAYLKERGLKGETAKAFGIGFAPDEWRSLNVFLSARGFSNPEIEKAGMAIKKSSVVSSQLSDFYDRFRSRIMFPLNNSSGQIAGFSARIFAKEDDKMGKYINTPQTILYDKSKLLYGFDKAKNEIRKKDFCILVEGQMDVIMSHQAGFKNTVAVSGTALTADHLRMIKRLTNNLVMAFDKDEAGLRASKKGIDMALAEGIEVKVAIVPLGKDPADAIKDNPKEWENAVSDSKHIIEFYLNSFSELPNNLKRKEIEKTVLPYIAILQSEIEKAHWVKETAKKLSISEEPIWEELKKVKSLRDSGSQNTREGNFANPAPRTRLKLLGDRLLGFVLWQKNADSADLKKQVELAAKKHGFKMPDAAAADKLVFEAELFYSNCGNLIEEFKKLDIEFEREKTKSMLEEITSEIRRLEAGRDESKLKECMDRFHELSKKLSEIE